jgi:hypothetical protein
MTHITPAPDREKFEREIRAMLDDQNLSAVARLLQKDQSAVSKAFSPNVPDRHNPIYQFVLYLWAFDHLKNGLADNVLNIVIREREKWTHEPFRRIVCGAKLTANVGREYSEFVEKELSEADIDILINEMNDVVSAAEEKKRDLMTRRNALHFGEFTGQPVSTKTYEMTKKVLNGRKQ